jgi:GT2 family glycosyltransferase
VREAAELGDHPALLALSVVNEIPRDVVRFYGERRVERFVRDLLDAAKQRAPECLLTYTNYPPTEFLRAGPVDFFCFNVYLEDPEKLGAYLDRLQHLAGTAPLVLGEHGFDSLRHGAASQARSVEQQVKRVFAHGLAGSFVFSYTDDWFAGGAAVQDWAFGMVDRAREPKPAAEALRGAWQTAPFAADEALPRVSVVVCSYNGAATLESCLRSLSRLRYPDYEVILIDDGSTDNTSEIAQRFPNVRYVRQENMGLSAARNVGARLAAGQIVAYTDGDCDADEDWLGYLVREMLRQNVDVIGGPNIPPPQDCDVARCVAVSPGGPSHVMLDDRLAEHVPGCNMAFRRDKLLAIGGFDEQFRQAGDDVDICWRFLDAGYQIGYASSAVVWHHRRTSVRAYLKQQAGYGRSEAMLYFKHPTRFNAVGSSVWNGVIYGEGATGLPWLPPVIYHGRFGTELFPAIYRSRGVSSMAYFTLLEWHAGAVMALLLAVLYPPMALVAGGMWLLTLVPVVRAGVTAPLHAGAPWWSRPLISILHLVQPVVRAWHRNKFRLSRTRLPRGAPGAARAMNQLARRRTKRMGVCTFDLYWTSARGGGREQLLEHTVQAAQEQGWAGDFHCNWDAHDLLLMGDKWHGMEVRTASEELGGGKRFTRARVRLRATPLAIVVAAGVTLWAALACARHVPWGEWVGLIACTLLAGRLLLSRHRCRRAAAMLLLDAGRRADLRGVDVRRTGASASMSAEAPSCARTVTHPADHDDELPTAANTG